MKVWIDLSNSPHPLLFAPVARRLRSAGADVMITARDNAQTVELARERWPDAEVIGGESPKGRAAKAATIERRILELRRWAQARKPDVALSHNSYAQIVAARGLRVPVVTAMDFEHQPVNHLAFRLARRVLLPEPLPLAAVRRQGASPGKVVRYPGLKEELYIGDFEPDGEILGRLGIVRRAGTVVVVARTPPSRAVYHQVANPLFTEALQTVCSQDNVVCVALTRHDEQRLALERLALRNCMVPPAAIDSRSLICAADLMIGAGGTMTREAALMGIPTWTVFGGKTPAVDTWLEQRGSLSRLTAADQLAFVAPRTSPPRSLEELRDRGAAIETIIAGTTVACGERMNRRRRPRFLA